MKHGYGHECADLNIQFLNNMDDKKALNCGAGLAYKHTLIFSCCSVTWWI